MRSIQPLALDSAVLSVIERESSTLLSLHHANVATWFGLLPSSGSAVRSRGRSPSGVGGFNMSVKGASHAGCVYVISERCSSTLEEYLLQRRSIAGGISLQELFDVVVDVVEGVAYLHAHRISHHRISPETVAWREHRRGYGHFKLTDVVQSHAAVLQEQVACGGGRGSDAVGEEVVGITLFELEEKDDGDDGDDNIARASSRNHSPRSARQRSIAVAFAPEADVYSVGVLILELAALWLNITPQQSLGAASLPQQLGAAESRDAIIAHGVARLHSVCPALADIAVVCVSDDPAVPLVSAEELLARLRRIQLPYVAATSAVPAPVPVPVSVPVSVSAPAAVPAAVPVPADAAVPPSASASSATSASASDLPHNTPAATISAAPPTPPSRSEVVIVARTPETPGGIEEEKEADGPQLSPTTSITSTVSARREATPPVLAWCG